MRCLPEDIAFEEDKLLLSEDELFPQIGRMNIQSLAQRSLPDSAADTELIVKEVDCNPIKHGPAGEHLNARNNPVINEGDKAVMSTAQRIVHDSSGTGKPQNISQQVSVRSKNLSDLSAPDKHEWSLGAECNELKGSAERNSDGRINTAGKFSESQKAETSVGSKLQVHELPNKSTVTRETRKSKKTVGGSPYKEVYIQYPANATSRLSGKGNARMLGSAGDQMLLHGGEGSSTKEEEKVTCSESTNNLDEGILDSRDQSRLTQGSEAFIQFPSGGVQTDYCKENISPFHEPLSEAILLKPEEHRLISINPLKERPVNTPFPFSLVDKHSDQGKLQNVNIKQAGNSGKDVSRQGACKDLVTMEERSDKEHVSLHMLTSQGSIEQENLESLEIMVTPGKTSEELPRLPRVKGLDKEEKSDRTGSSAKAMNMEASFLLGSFLDVPVGQEITSSGGKRTMGSSRLSVSQGIAEDASELVSGQATVGDGLSESVDYPNEYWDSDEYEDDDDWDSDEYEGDDDLGYIRKPIDEENLNEPREDEENLNEPREDEEVGVIEDEEAAAVQEQDRQIRAQEDDFETFNLKIVHRKNRTDFEEDKDFHVPNSVIADHYNVTKDLGSGTSSEAIQAYDLRKGMDVCLKIIKKENFDQGLVEIKLLEFVSKHDPDDEYHIARLYDYFYYCERLFIVCELLQENLYAFQELNREPGGEVYFTMPRLQLITIQCLEALQFLHGLGLIHRDLKPENIVVKDRSSCEVKVIDLGLSCFQMDHLDPYVQSRSYRAPEVILGLPYDKKIDIWSLGCILAELCSGNVLFQNDSCATLLARVIGIIGPIEQEMLVKGRDTSKYFTKNHMLYEWNQETKRLEYLIPKKTSLRHRLQMGDQGFIDFVSYLLEINPNKRPSAAEALKHHWLLKPNELISP